MGGGGLVSENLRKRREKIQSKTLCCASQMESRSDTGCIAWHYMHHRIIGLVEDCRTLYGLVTLTSLIFSPKFSFFSSLLSLNMIERVRGIIFVLYAVVTAVQVMALMVSQDHG